MLAHLIIILLTLSVLGYLNSTQLIESNHWMGANLSILTFHAQITPLEYLTKLQVANKMKAIVV